ncbi:MAG: pyridoxal 5'-phosphate synthase glutaminase subunit PdxT [Cyanobacteria bacterium PR.023]|nr:pyridoxal 5'-phosphate synthase glutaminase subunit PdxT [Cyanobacteria bacterium PR.023]
MVIGVLALQGDFAEHIKMLEQCGVSAKAVRYAEELDHIDGLIIPGGESTAVAKLTDEGSAPIFSAIKAKIAPSEKIGASSVLPMPVYGTCMGSIFLAKEIEGSSQGRLAVMDIKVKRNAFGPQRRSFESDLKIDALGAEAFPAVFIRAPVIVECGPKVQVLSAIDEGIVMARQDTLLVTAFHPEITNDLRVHQYFLGMVQEYRQAQSNAVRDSQVPEPVQV